MHLRGHAHPMTSLASIQSVGPMRAQRDAPLAASTSTGRAKVRRMREPLHVADDARAALQQVVEFEVRDFPRLQPQHRASAAPHALPSHS